jgi:uncharacterized SAM-binding protein YcdF (DUF218 family)
MMSSLKALVATLVMPFPLFLALVATGLLLWMAGRRRAGGSVSAGGALLLALAAWGPVAERLLAPLENHHPPVTDAAALAGVTAVVVLGGGWQPNPERPISAQLNESSVIRLFEGLRLLRALPEARLIVSGASPRGDRAPVARGYAQAARELGIPAAHVTILDTPVDTAQEAYAVRAALGIEPRFVLVTSASHMPRAVRHFQWVGLDPLPAPTQYLTGRLEPDRLRYWIPSADHLRKTERACYEYLGLLALEWDH